MTASCVDPSIMRPGCSSERNRQKGLTVRIVVGTGREDYARQYDLLTCIATQLSAKCRAVDMDVGNATSMSSLNAGIFFVKKPPWVSFC